MASARASTVGNENYDVFISYSRADARYAVDIDTLLRQKGLRTFFDQRNLVTGLDWVRALEEAIGNAKAAVILLGPSGLGNTQQYERELAFIRQTSDPSFPVIPVLLPDTRDPPFNFLRVLTWVDFSKVTNIADAPGQTQRLLASVQTRVEGPEAFRLDICPYRGLDPFREEDSAFFFGRGSASDPASPIGQLVEKVHDHGFVMVVGPSGNGKSSLVYAGLVPALRRERDRFWTVLSLKPGTEPLQAIAEAFNPKAADEGAAAYATKITEETEALRKGNPGLLTSMIRQYLQRAEGKPDRLLLYIDQWEELYAQTPQPGEVGRPAQRASDVTRFIDLLLNAARSGPVTVVATIRADFYSPLIGHPDMRALLPTQQVLLGSMTRSELESTIVEPAKMVGLAFDPPTLVQRILEDAGEDEGMLPLLQYALKETWDQREGKWLTRDSYERSGGVQEAIRITAERTFNTLSPEDQQRARQLFLRLVTPGEGQEDTRARAAMPDDQTQRKIVEQFADRRTRLLVTGFDQAKRPTVEVAHEALIRRWPRLRTWISASRDKLRSRAAVLQAKTEWEENSRREDLLLPSGFQLERARNLLDNPGDITIDDIKEFVSLSSAREEATLNLTADVQRRRVRNRNVALAAVSSLALLAGLLAWIAEQQRATAVTSLKVAEEQRKQADDILTGATKVFANLFNQVDTNSRKDLFAVMEAGAAHGDAHSMFSLGWFYANGFGVTQDYAKARQWYERAADNGEARAMNALGVLYDRGEGVGQDYAKARQWYEKGVDNGNAQAMSNLGVLYNNGHGVAQDYVKAREWFEKAADNGNADAMFSVGSLYDNGYGVTQDYVKALQWYEKAANNGDVRAMTGLGVLYDRGEGVGQDYVKAREWYEKAASNGSAMAMNNLGSFYANGHGVAQDYVKAREWLEKAADKGDADALNNLGLLYANGWGVARDYVKAREWFEKAAHSGSALAMNKLGLLYANGLGVAQDYVKAREWFEKAADQGDANANASLKVMQIEAAAAAGRYTEALRLREASAGEEEAAETKRDGKPGEDTAGALLDVAQYALLAREYGKALTASERAHALLPDNLAIEANRAHALMFLGRQAEARALYLAYKGKRVQPGVSWESVVADDFAKFRKAGLTHPIMADIEKELQASN
jgi:TPR repeat protein